MNPLLKLISLMNKPSALCLVFFYLLIFYSSKETRAQNFMDFTWQYPRYGGHSIRFKAFATFPELAMVLTLTPYLAFKIARHWHVPMKVQYRIMLLWKMNSWLKFGPTRQKSA